MLEVKVTKNPKKMKKTLKERYYTEDTNIFILNKVILVHTLPCKKYEEKNITCE